MDPRRKYAGGKAEVRKRRRNQNGMHYSDTTDHAADEKFNEMAPTSGIPRQPPLPDYLSSVARQANVFEFVITVNTVIWFAIVRTGLRPSGPSVF